MKFINLLRHAQFHGALRLTERRYRWWWAIAIFLLFGCSISVILASVYRFFDNPTFLVRQETIFSKMPFPTVLICPEITFHDEKIEQFLEEVDFPPGLNASYMKGLMRQLAAYFSPDVVYERRDLEDIEYLLYHNGLGMETVGKKLMTTCEETFIRCRWNGKIVNCSAIFQMELTGDGYCCVFNGRSIVREIREHGIKSKLTQAEWFSSLFGPDTGLMLVINQTQKLDNVDLAYKWLALQGSQHYVETTANGVPLNPGFELWASYTTEGFQIGDDARTLSYGLRHCRMADQSLKLFPIYHRDYCLAECEIERTIDQCNCVRHVHPKPPVLRYCRARSLLCANQAMVPSDTEECECPQACDVATDIVHTTNIRLIPRVKPFDTFYDGLNFSTVTVVRVYLARRIIKTKSRWSYFSSADLFSQLGGVFNMFLGVSTLTILELIQLAWHGLRHRRMKNQPRVKPTKPEKSKAKNILGILVKKQNGGLKKVKKTALNAQKTS